MTIPRNIMFELQKTKDKEKIMEMMGQHLLRDSDKNHARLFITNMLAKREWDVISKFYQKKKKSGITSPPKQKRSK